HQLRRLPHCVSETGTGVIERTRYSLAAVTAAAFQVLCVPVPRPTNRPAFEGDGQVDQSRLNLRAGITVAVAQDAAESDCEVRGYCSWGVFPEVAPCLRQ